MTRFVSWHWWIGLLTFEALLIPLAWLLSEPPGVLPQVRVAGQKISGSSFREVHLQCRHLAQQLAEQSIVLIVEGKRLEVKVRDLGFTFRPEVAAAQAWLTGRELSLLQRLRSRLQARKGIMVPMPVQLTDEGKLRRCFQKLNEPAQNATAVLIDNKVCLIAEQQGWFVDYEGAKKELLKGLSQGRTFFFLPIRYQEPSITKEKLTGVTALRAQVSLTMTSNHPNAYRNAQVAINTLDKTVLLPGQILSLNAVLGQRTRERGYLPAPVFINERMDLDVGGGVCPVSTAVFQAAALGGLEIVERHPHGRLVRYSKPGLDATLNYPNKDLKILNQTPAPVVLRTSLKGKHIVVQILGAPKPESIWLETESWRKGKWLHVVTYRVIDGQRHSICQSRYRLQQD